MGTSATGSDGGRIDVKDCGGSGIDAIDCTVEAAGIVVNCVVDVASIELSAVW